MIKILIIFVSRNLDNNNLKNIKENLIDSLKTEKTNIDLALVSSDNNNNRILNFKYEIICKSGQFSKITQLLNTINIDDYDWYIKIRPELFFHEKITLNKIISLSKNKINSRVRQYLGPEINIKKSVSIPTNDIIARQHCKNKKTWALNDFKRYNLLIVNPDDQFYIFHNNIARIAFNKIKEEEINNNLIVKEINTQRENFHGNIWRLRDIEINIISIDLTFRNFRSGDLLISKKTPYFNDNNLSWLKKDWIV